MPADSSSEEMPTLFERLAALDPDAFGEIYRRCRTRLLHFASYRVSHEAVLQPTYDAEDAMESGMRDMWIRLGRAKIIPPDGMDDFLRLARTIIAGRIKAKVRELKAAKRFPSTADGDGDIRYQGRFVPDDLDLWPSNLDKIERMSVDGELNRWLLSILGDELRGVAEDRIAGLTIDSIAQRRGRSRRTVERRLQEIRAIWEQALRDS
jgi:RNA polymerase sigma factor (sigma-70 family)